MALRLYIDWSEALIAINFAVPSPIYLSQGCEEPLWWGHGWVAQLYDI